MNSNCSPDWRDNHELGGENERGGKSRVWPQFSLQREQSVIRLECSIKLLTYTQKMVSTFSRHITKINPANTILQHTWSSLCITVLMIFTFKENSSFPFPTARTELIFRKIRAFLIKKIAFASKCSLKLHNIPQINLYCNVISCSKDINLTQI